MLGVLVSLLRMLTKAVYPQDPDGLRKCVNLYFAVGIVVMIVMRIKSHGFRSFSNLIYIVTLSIFPGYITEDVHSELLGDWTEIPVAILTSLLGLINENLKSVLMSLAWFWVI
ncbi:hypothetical protein Bca52824_083947 [Brassica carinata]|uniref:Uncharacterized protein n=1 Tax=Brassica carinata TaxID=52824 RepID=A0A8X7PL39_BRACI|nr:hypothetical protein Bca52824_083947 [Brassica carinata]